MTKSEALFIKYLRIRLECTWTKLYCHHYNRYELKIPFTNEEHFYSSLGGRKLCHEAQDKLCENWQDEWGGHLELWDKDLKTLCIKVAPIFNRVIVFNTSETSYHGHPHPLNTPPGVSRNSLALYYYTKDRPEEEKAPWHSVVWKNSN